MKRTLLGLALLLSLSAAGEAGAEEWTFERIAAEAMRTYPAVEARRHAEAAAAADLDTAKWQRYPVPALSASQDTKSKNALTASLQQPLWAGGRISSGIDAASARRDASREATRSTQQDVLAKVIEQFVEAGLKQRQMLILDKGIEQHQNLLAMIGRRVERQFSPHADLELASSRLRTAQNDKSYAVQACSIALAQLSEYAGGDVSSVSTSQEELVRSLPVSLEVALSQAVAASPALAYLEKSKTAAEADVETKRAAYWPSLSARVEKVAGSYPDTRALLLVESQFGSGLSAASGVDSASAALRASQAQIASARRELRTQVAQQWSTYVEAHKRYGNSAATSRSAWSVYESYRRLYTISQKSWLDVLNQLREAVQADLNEESARAEVTKSALQLLLLTGKLTPKADDAATQLRAGKSAAGGPS
jgi:adhesin transport system outer membrane protein